MTCLRQMDGVNRRVAGRQDRQEYSFRHESNVVFSRKRTLDSPKFVSKRRQWQFKHDELTSRRIKMGKKSLQIAGKLSGCRASKQIVPADFQEHDRGCDSLRFDSYECRSYRLARMRKILNRQIVLAGQQDWPTHGFVARAHSRGDGIADDGHRPRGDRIQRRRDVVRKLENDRQGPDNHDGGWRPSTAAVPTGRDQPKTGARHSQPVAPVGNCRG